MNIIYGIIGIILSIALIIYRAPIKNFIGQIEWAENKFGPGGTYTLMLFIGIAGFFISLMIMTGTLNLLFGGDVPVDLFKSVK